LYEHVPFNGLQQREVFLISIRHTVFGAFFLLLV
jgi:hypothetical protein